MANFIKSIVQQSLSFLLMLVVAFSAFSGVLFLNPIPSYAFNLSDVDRALMLAKDLSGADLSEANLYEADLSGADLSGADLSFANLTDANLSGANLIKANLIKADLNGANLNGANLNRAMLYETDLSNAIADSKTKFPDRFDANGAGVYLRK
jgi:uncharacterized protein YjbI with pentapeptide repeats